MSDKSEGAIMNFIAESYKFQGTMLEFKQTTERRLDEMTTRMNTTTYCPAHNQILKMVEEAEKTNKEQEIKINSHGENASKLGIEKEETKQAQIQLSEKRLVLLVGVVSAAMTGAVTIVVEIIKAGLLKV